MAALSAGVRLSREIGSKFLVEFLSFGSALLGCMVRSMHAMALASLPFRRAWEILNSRISKAIGRGAADYNFCSYVTQGFGQKG